MKTTKLVLLIPLIIIFAIGCGGKKNQRNSLQARALADTPEDYDPITAILGENPQLDTSGLDDEDEHYQPADHQTADTPQTQDQDYIGGNMAVFYPTVIANNEEIKATYRINEASAAGTLVKDKLQAGREVELHPGVYDITFTTNQIAGNPEMTLRGVELEAGRRLKRQVRYPVGTITLVTSGGGCRTSKITIREKGATDWLPGNYTTCKPIRLMAGEYEAKQGVVEITGIQVYDGGTRNVTIRSQ